MSEPRLNDRTIDRLGRYRLLAVLGRGGMGDVYLAVVEGLEGFSKLLVVKELRREHDDDLYLGMFMDEARLAARLNHPHIVQTLEVGSDGPRRFMVMEYLEGHSLHKLTVRERKHQRMLPTHLYVGIVVHVLDALAYIHDLTDLDGSHLGIVHRDVTPQNVIVSYDGHVKLIDFGIAKTRVASQQTTAGIVKGKVRYMAPEQATGAPVDQRTDVFAVGMMLWDALLGRGPWEGQSELQILHGLVTGAIPRLRDQSPNVSEELAAIVDRATHPLPAERYPSASAMRQDLIRHVDVAPFGDHRRALGEVVSRAFASERAELRTLIDARLRGASAEGGLSPISLTRVRSPYADAAQSIVTSAPTALPEPANQVEETSGPRAGEVAAPPARSPWYRRALPAAVVVLGFAGAVAAVTRVGHRSSVVPPSAESATPAQPIPQAPDSAQASPAPIPSAVRVFVRALPDTARLVIDGAAVSNPYQGHAPHDGSTHTVVAEGPGLVRRTLSFEASSDTKLEIALDRAPPVRAVGRQAETPERASAPSPVTDHSPAVERSAPGSPGDVDTRRAPAEVPAPRPRRTREVDKENPYAP